MSPGTPLGRFRPSLAWLMVSARASLQSSFQVLGGWAAFNFPQSAVRKGPPAICSAGFTVQIVALVTGTQSGSVYSVFPAGNSCPPSAALISFFSASCSCKLRIAARTMQPMVVSSSMGYPQLNKYSWRQPGGSLQSFGGTAILANRRSLETETWLWASASTQLSLENSNIASLSPKAQEDISATVSQAGSPIARIQVLQQLQPLACDHGIRAQCVEQCSGQQEPVSKHSPSRAPYRHNNECFTMWTLGCDSGCRCHMAI